MRIAVWDTYVKRDDGRTMHFDILVPSTTTDEQVVVAFGKVYLKTKSFSTHQLTAHECRLCHMERATQTMISDIERQGYSILEMENCT